jgi:hypothetical protein
MPQREGGAPPPPDQWKSGDEPMTESQASFLKRLTSDAGEPFDQSLSKAAASRRIDELLTRAKGAARSSSGGGRASRKSPAARKEQSGEDSMSKAQAAYLKELAEEEGGDFDPDLSKDEAARRIGELLIKQMARRSPTEESRR